MRPLVFALLVAWFALGALLAVGTIGKPRKVSQPSHAVVALVLYALEIAGVWYLAWGSR
jgi:NADH:ubiquinone oxidoreductase subunit 6 (subunit J)